MDVTSSISGLLSVEQQNLISEQYRYCGHPTLQAIVSQLVILDLCRSNIDTFWTLKWCEAKSYIRCTIVIADIVC
jgi:hypothetical protein